MKLIKRLFILVLIIGAFFAGVTYYQGRQQYTDAVAQVPVEEKIQQIRSMENYTAYSQLRRLMWMLSLLQRTSGSVTMADMT